MRFARHLLTLSVAIISILLLSSCFFRDNTLSDDDVLEMALNDLNIHKLTVEKNFILPDFIEGGIKITWESSNEDVIKIEQSLAIVIPQTEDISVVLTATLSLNSATKQKEFTFIVKARLVL